MFYCLREKAIGRQKKILYLVCDLQRVCLPVLKYALIGQNTISKAARVKLSAFFLFFLCGFNNQQRLIKLWSYVSQTYLEFRSDYETCMIWNYDVAIVLSSKNRRLRLLKSISFHIIAWYFTKNSLFYLMFCLFIVNTRYFSLQ